ncbi:hypothetical protein SI859A1_02460 [Aurantimonas manganoxydans SI85-9A1]|uniref:Uncharacterized protein n=1 Tax=Aurantimonas manganoxydans (strain ATCC BAA-1229 / DSM 21871 / SI85-9A1) TaxID=287752 RepID=Q1YLT7_AURMS|nr:hypothetical protein SI859A1_02460 [Aurantimonas manganoxydans SI85-9A1]
MPSTTARSSCNGLELHPLRDRVRHFVLAHDNGEVAFLDDAPEKTFESREGQVALHPDDGLCPDPDVRLAELQGCLEHPDAGRAKRRAINNVEELVEAVRKEGHAAELFPEFSAAGLGRDLLFQLGKGRVEVTADLGVGRQRHAALGPHRLTRLVQREQPGRHGQKQEDHAPQNDRDDRLLATGDEQTDKLRHGV